MSGVINPTAGKKGMNKSAKERTVSVVKFDIEDYEPTDNGIVVKLDLPEETTEGGLYKPDEVLEREAQSINAFCEVVAAGRNAKHLIGQEVFIEKQTLEAAGKWLPIKKGHYMQFDAMAVYGVRKVKGRNLPHSLQPDYGAEDSISVEDIDGIVSRAIAKVTGDDGFIGDITVEG